MNYNKSRISDSNVVNGCLNLSYNLTPQVMSEGGMFCEKQHRPFHNECFKKFVQKISANYFYKLNAEAFATDVAATNSGCVTSTEGKKYCIPSTELLVVTFSRSFSKGLKYNINSLN